MKYLFRLFSLLIKKAQIHTDIQLIPAIKKGIWVNLGTVVRSLIGFVLLILFANQISEATYGIYRFAYAYLALFSILSLRGADHAILRSSTLGQTGEVRTMFRKRVYWSLIAIPVSLCFAGYYTVQSNLELAKLFILIGVSTPFIFPAQVWASYLNGIKDYKSLGTYEIIQTLIQNIPLILVLLLLEDVFIIITVSTIFFALSHLLVYWHVLRTYPINQNTTQETYALAKHYSVIGTLTQISSNIDQILLFHLLGPIQLAIYSFAIRIPQEVHTILRTTLKISLPTFVIQTSSTLKKSVISKLIFVFYTSIIIFLGYVILAPFIFQKMFPAYTDAIPYTLLFALSIILAPRILLRNVFIAQGSKKILYTLEMITTGSKILLLFVMVPLYGIIGAITSLLLVYSLELLLAGAFFFRQFKEHK